MSGNKKRLPDLPGWSVELGNYSKSIESDPIDFKPAFFKTDNISLPVKLGTDVMQQLIFFEYPQSQVVPVLHLELQDKAQ